MSACGVQDFFEHSQPQRGTPQHSGYKGICDMHLADHHEHAALTQTVDRAVCDAIPEPVVVPRRPFTRTTQPIVR
jgi:hypothetical protein